LGLTVWTADVGDWSSLAERLARRHESAAPGPLLFAELLIIAGLVAPAGFPPTHGWSLPALGGGAAGNRLGLMVIGGLLAVTGFGRAVLGPAAIAGGASPCARPLEVVFWTFAVAGLLYATYAALRSRRIGELLAAVHLAGLAQLAGTIAQISARPSLAGPQLASSLAVYFGSLIPIIGVTLAMQSLETRHQGRLAGGFGSLAKAAGFLGLAAIGVAPSAAFWGRWAALAELPGPADFKDKILFAAGAIAMAVASLRVVQLVSARPAPARDRILDEATPWLTAGAWLCFAATAASAAIPAHYLPELREAGRALLASPKSVRDTHSVPAAPAVPVPPLR
jgi:hypothetical protein